MPTTMPLVDREAVIAQPTAASWPDILVATDGSEAADGAVCVGALLAEQRQLDVELLTVLDASHATLAHASAADTRVRQQLRQFGARRERFRIEVRSGPTAKTIALVAREHRSSTIIVGDRRRGVIPPPSAGTASRLMPLGDAPMLIVPSWVRALPSRVVMAVDFSMPSIRAARAAIELFGGFARLDLVHVGQTASAPLLEWNHWEDGYDGGLRGAFARLLDDLELLPAHSVDTWVLEGDPASEILRFAERAGCDLVTAGGCDRGFFQRLRDHSVSQRLAGHADWMTLIAPRAHARDGQGFPYGPHGGFPHEGPEWT